MEQRTHIVSLQIRAFQNTDVQPLCRVLSAHYAAIGLPSAFTPLTLELCVLAKPYFDPELLLVAENDGEIAGWILMGFEADSQLQSLNPQNAVVSCLCVAPGPVEELVAGELIKYAAGRLAARGVTQVQYCPPPPNVPYLAGLVPGDGMIGLPELDIRQQKWLSAAGWQAGIEMESWELDLGRFQPPMDRTQIQIRRMAHVDRLLDEPLLPWYTASVFSHTEPVGFQLTNRQDKRVAAEVIIWIIGQELLPQPEVVAHLWPLNLPGGELLADQLVFLVAESLRQLRGDRVDGVRTVTAAANRTTRDLLQRIGFTRAASGHVLRLSL